MSRVLRTLTPQIISTINCWFSRLPSQTKARTGFPVYVGFWATVCKTVRPMLLDLSVCDVGVLWPNGWMDQDANLYGSKSRPTSRYMRTQLPPERGTAAPQLFGLFIVAKRSPISATAEFLLFFVSTGISVLVLCQLRLSQSALICHQTFCITLCI